MKHLIHCLILLTFVACIDKGTSNSEPEKEGKLQIENTIELCTDKIDNDDNGQMDCADQNCWDFKICEESNSSSATLSSKEGSSATKSSSSMNSEKETSSTTTSQSSSSKTGTSSESTPSSSALSSGELTSSESTPTVSSSALIQSSSSPNLSSSTVESSSSLPVSSITLPSSSSVPLIDSATITVYASPVYFQWVQYEAENVVYFAPVNVDGEAFIYLPVDGPEQVTLSGYLKPEYALTHTGIWGANYNTTLTLSKPYYDLVFFLTVETFAVSSSSAVISSSTQPSSSSSVLSSSSQSPSGNADAITITSEIDIDAGTHQIKYACGGAGEFYQPSLYVMTNTGIWEDFTVQGDFFEVRGNPVTLYFEDLFGTINWTSNDALPVLTLTVEKAVNIRCM